MKSSILALAVFSAVPLFAQQAALPAVPRPDALVWTAGQSTLQTLSRIPPRLWDTLGQPRLGLHGRRKRNGCCSNGDAAFALRLNSHLSARTD